MRTLVTTCFLWCCAMLCSTSLWAVPQSAASAMSKPTQLLFLVSQRNAETVAEAARRVAQLHPDIRIQARTDTQLLELPSDQRRALLAGADPCSRDEQQLLFRKKLKRIFHAVLWSLQLRIWLIHKEKGIRKHQ